MDEIRTKACFRCGIIEGPVDYDAQDTPICGACREPAIVNFIEALDLLNDLYLKGLFELETPMHELDFEDDLFILEEDFENAEDEES